ncbi:MAG: glutamate-5-semialdehyde dehydrogenase [Clostridia bacterium]|nr:glutamate-5-semialdehyde dehydrogenase [Clostridia bacterium]
MADNNDFDRIQYLNELGEAAVRAERVLSRASTAVKNEALLLAAKLLKERESEIIGANATDVDAAAARGMSVSMQDRLRLTTKRIDDIAEGLRQVAALPDPVGDVLDGGTRPNGLRIVKTRVPLGVLGIIYEARPNVTADAAALCVKSGNACILRGGKEAINSNKAVAAVFREALGKAGLPEDCVQLITDTSRETAAEFMKLDKYVDVLIPRGGAGLINAVLTQATVPVIQTGTGNCHVYVDKAADLDMAEKIVVNAKTQRPSVCNAMETLLVHADVANEFLPRICRELIARNVELRVCKKSKKILTAAGFDAGTLKDATEADWATEYDDLILAVKIVDSLEEAIEHISTYTTHHSEAIVTRDYNAASEFQLSIDAACVYVNASTRFTDGFEFGLGAEIGISNQKLHTRGPMGLKELTTVKYLINGDGQVRG